MGGRVRNESGAGADPEGLRTVASSTRVRFSSSLADPRVAVAVRTIARRGGVAVTVDETDLEAELVERVAAIDVAKAGGMVCTRVPHGTRKGRRVQEVWNAASTTAGILELGARLNALGITRVVMEATGVYWKPFFFLLESCGLECWLVNARDVKNVPGRPKTDKLDAVWLAKLAERGMLRASFVPQRPLRQLRDLTRLRSALTQERTRHKHRVEKVLEDAQIKLSSVLANIFGLSGRLMLDALISGVRDPQELAALAQGKAKSKREALTAALTGQFDEHHAYLLGTLLEAIDRLQSQIDELTTRITDRLAELSRDADVPDADGLTPQQRLDEIPGIGPATAQVILAEIGLDMSVFPTAGHLVSWAKLSPRTIQSAGKNFPGGTGQGNPWLKGALGEAAMAAARTNTFLGARYKRLVKRRGHGKALVAVARSILVIVWHLLSDPDARFHDLGSDYHLRVVNSAARTRGLIRQLEALGHDVTIAPKAV
ncbi:IS110 family transposase [Streptomyces sp. KR55]|uniref:IS110 family transposase n=1 Tax=Streptomyces sp. KR55 TaxID=3457425 RepID=UPI003FD5D7F3